MIFVKDNGIGIPDRFKDEIFTIFRRLHGKDEYGAGSGAGLSIVKRIAQRHGWEIKIESIVDEGSTFFISIAP